MTVTAILLFINGGLLLWDALDVVQHGGCFGEYWNIRRSFRFMWLIISLSMIFVVGMFICEVNGDKGWDEYQATSRWNWEDQVILGSEPEEISSGNMKGYTNMIFLANFK